MKNRRLISIDLGSAYTKISIRRDWNGESDLLRDLHRQGATVCMVTHDPRYARFAERTIHLFDGRIVEEVVENASTTTTH